MDINKDSHQLSLDDIARLSGVSRSTASRVINEHPHVSDSTRQKVLAVIEQHNFQPNAAARALALQRSRVIGIIVPHIITELFSDPFFAILLQSIITTANAQDYSVNLWLTSQVDNTNTLYRILNDSLLEGFIVAEASISPDFLEQLYLQKRVFVLVGRPSVDHLPINFVDFENIKGGRLVTEHLIERGRRTIVFMPGRPTLTSSIDRQAGYEQAMAAAGLPILIGEPGHFTKDAANESMKNLIPQKPDAVFCANDMMAVSAIRAIQQAGLRVPEDIAVAGFDDESTVIANINPPLTTVRQNTELSGNAVAQTLIDLIEGTIEQPTQVILPVELVIRQST